MSSWSLLLACQGFIYDGPRGVLGFKPNFQPDDHRSFFTTAEGWGIFSQRREAGAQTEKIDVRYGKISLKELVFELPEDAANLSASIRIEKRDVPVTVLRN